VGEPSIGVAVVGAGMAGRSHAFAYRTATTVFDDAIREQLRPGSLGGPLHSNGHYWCEYGCDPRAPR
jgi:hypothetical protein